jgi:hypothetical protein
VGRLISARKTVAPKLIVTTQTMLAREEWLNQGTGDKLLAAADASQRRLYANDYRIDHSQSGQDGQRHHQINRRTPGQ